jgi:hypothetical protein
MVAVEVMGWCGADALRLDGRCSMFMRSDPTQIQHLIAEHHTA